MNAYAAMENPLRRIATATSALRVRANDLARNEQNGGTTDELRRRVDQLIGKLEHVADQLEDALA